MLGEMKWVFCLTYLFEIKKYLMEHFSETFFGTLFSGVKPKANLLLLTNWPFREYFRGYWYNFRKLINLRYYYESHCGNDCNAAFFNRFFNNIRITQRHVRLFRVGLNGTIYCFTFTGKLNCKNSQFKSTFLIICKNLFLRDFLKANQVTKNRF